MTPDSPTAVYLRLLIRYNRLMAEGKGKSDEAEMLLAALDRLRDEIDKGNE